MSYASANSSPACLVAWITALLSVVASCGSMGGYGASDAAAGNRRAEGGTHSSVDIVLDTPRSIKADKTADWMELPATDDPHLYFITHPMTLGNTVTRNYSFYWDADALVARWVAYPLNAWTISTGSRSDAWGLDPKIPRAKQPVLFSTYRGGSYDRGHQCPSADRLSYAANRQTFYGVNMTPQLKDLNGGAWALLEGYTRTWSRSFDTLYVATGCVTDGSRDYALDNDGKKVKVPTGYYKALLGYRIKGNTGSTSAGGGYMGIAFWFDQASYPSTHAAVMGQAMTIAELEKRTGVDFFVNLPAKIGKELSDKVEHSLDSWWK